MSETSANTTERPTGSVSGLLYDYSRRLRTATRHADAEGEEVHPQVILDSYDRALHPWIHGRRPHDLAERVRKWWSR